MAEVKREDAERADSYFALCSNSGRLAEILADHREAAEKRAVQAERERILRECDDAFRFPFSFNQFMAIVRGGTP